MLNTSGVLLSSFVTSSMPRVACPPPPPPPSRRPPLVSLQWLLLAL